MYNWIVFHLHIFLVCVISLGMLRLGERALNAWLCVIAIAMNLFVTKQISLGCFQVTASEALAGSYLLGLCLIQEHFGRKSARMHVLFSFACSVGFLGLSWIHMLYLPNEYDTMNEVFGTLLSPMPRLIFASLTSFVLIQLVDISFFQWLRKKFNGRFFQVRTFMTMGVAMVLDTFLFSFLGLYGLVNNIWHLIFFSLIIKLICAGSASAFAGFSNTIPWLKPPRANDIK